jgi:hypothetical protein
MFLEKLAVCLFGAPGASPEAVNYMDAQLTPEAMEAMEGSTNPFTSEAWARGKERIAIAHERAIKNFQQQSGNALIKGDVLFFERLAELGRSCNDPKAAIADVIGSRVLLVWLLLKIFGFRASSPEITKLVSRQFPRENGYDEAQIRTVMRELGLPRGDT